MAQRRAPAAAGRHGGARRLILPAALCALLAAGCAGYMRPIPVCDGRTVILLMAGDTLGEPDPETRIMVCTDDDGWRTLGLLGGTARAAALWDGRLWVVYRENCSAYSLDGPRPVREAVHLFGSGQSPAALAVSGGTLWALTVSGTRLQAWRLVPAPEPAAVDADPKAGGGDRWEQSGSPLELGTAVAGSLRAAGGPDGVWALWRKRDAGGGIGDEVYSARLEGGFWIPGPGRSMPRAEIAACAEPDGTGIAVIASSPADDRLGRELTLSRLSAAGWGEPRTLDIPAREFGSAAIGLGLCPAPARDRGALLLFIGRHEGLAVFRVGGVDDSVGPWLPGATVALDVRGLETLLAPMLLLAGLLVGIGLGTAAVRRTRVFPLLPGQPAPAPLPARAGAWLADNMLVALLFYPALLATGIPMHAILRNEGLSLLVLSANRVLFVFYAAVFEARLSATPGKLFFGLRVTDCDGHRPSVRAALVRNAMRFLDEALVFPLPGTLMALVSRRAQRLGDLLAETMVTTKKSLGELTDDRRRKSDRFGLP